MGKQGDLLKYAKTEGQVDTSTSSPIRKRARNPASTALGNTKKKAIKAEDTGVKVKVETTNAELSKIKVEKSELESAPSDPILPELLTEDVTGSGSQKKESLKTEEAANGETTEKVRLATKRTSRKRKVVDTSDDVLDKVDDLIQAPVKEPKAKRKKAHPYGLTPGASPFPDHAKPTPEDCEEVHRLLTELHGEHKAPDVIPAPSMQVSGCGEVPDLLDALMRTLLSASTTAKNANAALAGLVETFGLRESGIGKGSVNWEAVHKADVGQVKEAIYKGGLADTKSKRIKEVLDLVHSQNCFRRDALLKEKETGETAGIAGAANATAEQQETEISMASESLLSLDYIFEMTTDEAMDEMTKLPGIGVKTASCVILFCMKRPSFAVDTHVWRHCKWLGWVPPNANRDKTFSHCEVRIPDHLKYGLHQLFLKHGKNCGHCQAKTSAGTEEWDATVCPLEHLVIRTEAKKQPGYQPSKKSLKGKKVSDEETDEESDVEMDD